MRRSAEALAAALAELESKSLRRQRVTATPDGGATVLRDGRRVVNFCSNDYLGLARHPALIAAMQASAARAGAGSGASHLVTGHGAEHEALERELAEFTGRERALLFSTGYMANLGVVSALAERADLVLEDRLNHASLIDAGLLARADLQRYAHGDADAAQAALVKFRGTHTGRDGSQSDDGRGALLVTDGVFSMDGDLAPLPALARAAREHDAWLIVDDAHGLGVLGANGGGCLEHFGLGSDDVPVLIGTLGKAFGSFGAFVAGDAALIDWLIQRARTYIYTTALPQPVAAATRAALTLMRSESWRRAKLREHIDRFRERARRRGLDLADSAGHEVTPIQPIVLGNAQRALDVSAKLLAAGWWVAAIRPPTVPQGSARLRVTLSAAHDAGQIDALVDALAQACEAA
jgi:8-amino-7-oxononanoate synthase